MVENILKKISKEEYEELQKYFNNEYGLKYNHITEIFQGLNIDDFYYKKFNGLSVDNNLSINNKKINHNLIESENYFALKELEKNNNKFNLIYIDPPYNTGSKDFLYNDKYVESDDPDKHSRWLSFMDHRLTIAKKLLTEKGCLIASIGENEFHNLALLLKKHFNFVSEPIIWESKTGGNNNKQKNTTNISTEFILIAYNDKKFQTNYETHSLSDENNEYSQKKKNRYKKGIFIKKELNDYPVETINGKRVILIPEEDYSIDDYNEESFKGHRFQRRTSQKGHGSWKYKTLYEDAKKITNKENFLMVMLDVKDKQGLGVKFQYNQHFFQSISDNIKARMPNMLGYYQGGYKGFQTAKPVELLKRLFRNTLKNDNDKILDFFAGTGSTLQAICELNIEDNKKYEVTIITNNDNNICSDYTYPRVINNLYNQSLTYYKEKK